MLIEDNERLTETAKKYNKEDFKLFVSEVGYEEWMEEYIEGKDFTVKDSERIDTVLKEIFDKAHSEDV